MIEKAADRRRGVITTTTLRDATARGQGPWVLRFPHLFPTIAIDSPAYTDSDTPANASNRAVPLP